MPKALTNKQRLLLIEAARRYKQFAKEGESLTQDMAGLGTVKEYRPVEDAGLMRVVVQLGTRETPETLYWWKLTPRGAAIVKILISAMTLPEIWTQLEKWEGKPELPRRTHLAAKGNRLAREEMSHDEQPQRNRG